MLTLFRCCVGVLGQDVRESAPTSTNGRALEGCSTACGSVAGGHPRIHESAHSDNETSVRRLVLRNAQAAPDRGIIFDLYRPKLIDVAEPYLRFRGVEAMTIGSEERAAMLGIPP
jgi:hypothetical protein